MYMQFFAILFLINFKILLLRYYPIFSFFSRPVLQGTVFGTYANTCQLTGCRRLHTQTGRILLVG